MLVATRDHEPRANERHVAPVSSRSRMSYFTGAVQLVGSLVGIPLALASAYSIYHTNFSLEAKCQSLRSNIVSMLDRKADASTLRLLIQRDIVSFERDCGDVDADAVAAFKTLLAAERTSPARHVEARQKSESVAVAASAKADAPAKIETTMKAAAPKKPQAVPAAANRDAEATQEAKPVEASIIRGSNDAVDAAWVASVREALRESALRPQASEPAAEPPAPVAAPMPLPIVVPSSNMSGQAAAAASKPDHPVPPAPIPNPQGSTQSAD